MTRDQAHNPDPNVNAARIVAESTRADTALPADLEAAWAESPIVVYFGSPEFSRSVRAPR